MQTPYECHDNSVLKLVELKKQLEEEYIQPSKASYEVAILFQLKHDGRLQMCVDYRALTIKIKIK